MGKSYLSKHKKNEREAPQPRARLRSTHFTYTILFGFYLTLVS